MTPPPVNQILHADCLTYLPSLPADSIDCVITDSPYLISWKSKRVKGKGHVIPGDAGMSLDWVKECYRVQRPNTALYAFCHWSTYHVFREAIISAGYKICGVIVANKGNHGMADIKTRYAPKHEWVIFATKGTHRLNWHDGSVRRLPDVLDCPYIHHSRRLHSCEKPVSFLKQFIESSTKAGDLCLDPFCGSGSLPVACVETGRSYIGIDIDPACVETARKRLGHG